MTQPRSEYPRPQFQRDAWLNLNGEWQFDFDDENVGTQEKWFEKKDWSRTITVPFAYQSELSGIGELEFHDLVWYKKAFELPTEMKGKNIILHFGAVDYRAWVWVNGIYVTVHQGGHVPFHADITHCLREGTNEIVVKVEDISTDLAQPRGKQYWKEKSESIFYTRTTGIWQTVWIEAVNQTHLQKVKMTPDIDNYEIAIEYWVNHVQDGDQLHMDISLHGQTVAKEVTHLIEGHSLRRISLDHLTMDRGNKRLWSPEHPNLYDITFQITRKEQVIDQVQSYFGMRKISVENGKVYLNNAPYYMKMVLDQGYFPDGILTPPSDDALRKDVELTKEMGFNGARKHQKVEDPRYLYWADRLGLLVWGEMANSYVYTDQSVERITNEWQEVIERDYNHPSIVAWVPLNESWGVPNLIRNQKQRNHLSAMYHLTKSYDDSRLVISNDGWEHTISDLLTIHDYESRKEILKKRYTSLEHINASLPANRTMYAPGYEYQGEPILVTEFGGIGYKKSDWEGWGYSGATSDEEFAERYEAVVSALLESPLVQGFCYTQLTDVEQEINGLLTYDRQPKIPLETIKAINEANLRSRFTTEQEEKEKSK